MAKKSVKKSAKKEFNKVNESKLKAWITTFLSVIGFLIALIIWRDDKYVMFYAKQSIVIFCGFVIAGIIGRLAFIFWIGNILLLIVLLFWFASWIYALSGKTKDLPLVKEVTKKFNL